jgi:hypothetical protein
LYCSRCSYDLAGLASSRCPECGQPFEFDHRHTYRRRPMNTSLLRVRTAASSLIVVIGSIVAFSVITLSAIGVSAAGLFVASLLAVLVMLALVLVYNIASHIGEFPKRCIFAVIVLITIGVSASIFTTQWPLRTAFLYSRQDLTHLADSVLAGSSQQGLPVRMGIFTVRAVEHNQPGQVFLWLHVSTDGRTGLVRSDRRSLANIGRYWYVRKLDNDWYYVIEE